MNFRPDLSVDQLVQSSLRLRQNDDPEGARVLLLGAVSRHPDEPLLWHGLGLACRALLESAEAIAALERAIHLAPNEPKIAHAFAHISLEAGLPAIALFDRALALNPRDGGVVIGRAAAQFAGGEFDRAITDLEAACRASPHWLAGQQTLADLKWQYGHGADFVSGYRDALTHHPQAKSLWMGMIDSILKVEDYALAQKEAQAASRALGAVDELAPVMAICASELNDQTVADAAFAALFTKSAYLQSADLLSRGARHLLRTQRIEAAATLLETGLTLPDASKLWPYLATVWRILGDPRSEWLDDHERLVKRVQIYEPDELPELMHCLRGLHMTACEPPGQSVRKGTQTDGPLFARIEPPIADLRRRTVRAVQDYIADLGPLDPKHPTLGHRPRNVRFSGSWSVRLTGAGFHSNHVHPQGWLSSALCVAKPAISDGGPAPAGHLQFGVPPAELAIDLAPLRTVAPEPGWLTLFPSIMWHGTVPIKGGERMTVAFDVKP
jgi:tetratricopeptide (TPR) repeat protein